MYSFPIILQQIKAKNEQKKSEGATVARLSQTGYSTDSDFFSAQTSIFKQLPHKSDAKQSYI